MASSHRHGRLLPERPAPYMDWLVRAAASALVPCSHRLNDSGCRTRPCLDALSASAFPHHLLSDRHAISDRHHSHRKLHVPQLPCAGAGLSPARRWLCPADAATTLEELGHAGCNGVIRDTSVAVALCGLASPGVANRCWHLSWLDLLRDYGFALRHDSLRTAASARSGTCSGPISYRQPVRSVREHDP